MEEKEEKTKKDKGNKEKAVKTCGFKKEEEVEDRECNKNIIKLKAMVKMKKELKKPNKERLLRLKKTLQQKKFTDMETAKKLLLLSPCKFSPPAIQAKQQRKPEKISENKWYRS